MMGAIALEEPNSVPDCTRQWLATRDPRGIFAEVDG
jgi:hypothetical protein